MICRSIAAVDGLSDSQGGACFFHEACAMRRFMRRNAAQQPPPAEPEPELPCIIEAVEKLAAEMDGAQDILGKLQEACEREEAEAAGAQEGAARSAVPVPPTFRVGQRVVVNGLQAAPEHNGKLGTIESYRCATWTRSSALALLLRHMTRGPAESNNVLPVFRSTVLVAAAGSCASRTAPPWHCAAKG